MVVGVVRPREPTALSLMLLCVAANGCSGFVLQSSFRSTPYRSQAQQPRSFVKGTSSALRRPRVTRLPFLDKKCREYVVRIAAEPDEAVAEKESMAEEQSKHGGEKVCVDGNTVPSPEPGVSTGDTADAEEEVVAESTLIGEKSATEEEEGEEDEEEEEEEEDPMAEIKQRIKELEKDLQGEENKLMDIRESTQEKGQMGFLRMAAQVDNYRKTSGKGSGEYEADAKAAVLQAVLAAFVPFEEAEEKLNLETENEIKFNSNYQALYRQLKDAYAKIGASDFYGVVGEQFELRRHEKVSEEHNEVIPAGNILECLSPGLELRTNVIRKAACVVSLGPEKIESPTGVAEEGEAVEEEQLRGAGANGEEQGTETRSAEAEEDPAETEQEEPAT